MEGLVIVGDLAIRRDRPRSLLEVGTDELVV